MNSSYLLLVATFLIAAVLAAGCTGNSGPGTATPSSATPVSTPSGTVVSVSTPYTPPAKITTTPELVAFVANAAAYARENGREKAITAFNDPTGRFVLGTMHIFAIGYDGTVLADAREPEIVRTNIRDMTDSFGTPLVQNLAETARFGRGYVSYTYRNPEKNFTVEPQISVVEDVDGTYYVAAGMFASEGEVYPSVILNTSGMQPGVDDLVAYVKSAVTYARENGKEKALAVFNDPKGPFVKGELVMMAFDYNGANFASPPYSPELTKYHINLINYHDPDGVDTIRGMRDIAREGGGFFYTVTKVKTNGKEVYVPKIDYAEPVDGDWWVFSGIIVPEYTRIGAGDLAGIQIRNHTREELYELVNRTVVSAKTNGKEKTFAEINNPDGQFVIGDLFVWAESSDGTLLADPFWKSGIGKNQIDYADRYGIKTTQVGIEAMKNGTGFSHALFPNTAVNGTSDVPKLIYMKTVDDTWWIGGGVYGVEVR
jgi:signal transduction histidine kinase